MNAQHLITLLQTAGITTLQAAPIQGTPRWIGKSPDSLTTIEVVGALETIRGFGVLAVLDPDHHEATRTAITLMIDLLRFLAPAWSWSTNWLAACLKTFAAQRPAIALGQAPDRRSLPLTGGGEVMVQYLPQTSTISLKVRLGRATA